MADVWIQNILFLYILVVCNCIQIRFRRKAPVGNIDKLAIFTHPLRNVNKHHQHLENNRRKSVQIQNMSCFQHSWFFQLDSKSVICYRKKREACSVLASPCESWQCLPTGNSNFAILYCYKHQVHASNWKQ